MATATRRRRGAKWEPKNPQWRRLAADNLPLAYWCVNAYAPVSADEGDTPNRERWQSEALFALTKAARGYDPEYRTADGGPVRFSTYAVWAIRNQFAQTARRDGRAVPTVPLRADRSEAVSDDAAGWLAVEDGCERRLEAADQIAHLLERVRLTDQQREALRLHHWQGLSFVEIGRLWGVSSRRVQQVHSKALDALTLAATGQERTHNKYLKLPSGRRRRRKAVA
jgi:RNA polymerase sigma factor (sigma-70 family)